MKINGFLFLITLFIILLGMPVASAQVPSTDILLFEMDWKEEYRPLLLNPKWVTEREGYDNQPSFSTSSAFILYTRMEADGQTDIYQYSLADASTKQLTSTAESEYSPAVMPGGKYFSVVRVEGPDSIQRLWRFPLTKGKARVLMDQVNPIGYYAWSGKTNLGLFILGDKNTFQTCDFRKQNVQIVAYDIGRSLHAVPGENAVSFLVKKDVRQLETRLDVQPKAELWPIRKYNFETGTVSDICAAVPGGEDYAWTSDGRIFMGKDDRLYILDPSAENRWRLVSDLSGMGISDLSRIAVSADNRFIALVVVKH